MEMYLAGVRMRRVEDITEPVGQASELRHGEPAQPKMHQHISPGATAIEREFPYLFLDGVVLKRSWARDVRSVSMLVAFDGHLLAI